MKQCFNLVSVYLPHILNKPTLNKITTNAGKTQLAVLIDPDSIAEKERLIDTCKLCNDAGVDFIFVGGSLITNGFFEACISLIKAHTNIPVIIFPGDTLQVSKDADAILFLSLISGRNPDFLIGRQVLAAPNLKQSGIETIPTGYMLIDGGRATSVSYISNTTPLPADKPMIAATTAMAGEMLGLQCIFMDAGSGAQNPISAEMIKTVKQHISVPLIIGGGIRTAEQAKSAAQAGANIIVVGNAVEKEPTKINELLNAIR